MLNEKVQTYSVIFSHSLLKFDVTGDQTFFTSFKIRSRRLVLCIYLIWVGLCPSCGYADGQIWFKCSDDEVWENMIYFFFSHLNQSSKTHCCDKWKVFVFIAWSTEYSVHWSWMLFPYCNCFLACNDASCPYPPCPLPSVSDAFGQIDRLHFSR